MLRGEKTVSEIAAEHEIHPTVLHRWKTEVIENLPSVFSRGQAKQKRSKNNMRELSQTLKRSFVIRALKKVLTIRKPEIINSDQGSHFTCTEYIELLKSEGIKISMDGRGRTTDNAITERFFRNPKWEKIYYEEYRKPREVYRAVRAYIDEYNFRRPHSAIEYKRPSELYFGQSVTAQEALTTA